MPPLVLTPREFLVLFPMLPVFDASVYAVDEAPVDPAADLRVGDDSSYAGTTRLLRAAGMGIRAKYIEFLVDTWPALGATGLGAFGLASVALAVPVVAAALLLAPPSLFAAPQLGVGYTAIFLYLLTRPVSFNLHSRIGRFKIGAGEAAAVRANPTRLLAFANAYGFLQWRLLCKSVSSTGESDNVVLTYHDPGDKRCPCPRESCCGRISRRNLRWLILDFVMLLATVFPAQLAAFSTPMWFSLAPRFWSTPWSAAFGTLFLLALLAAGITSDVSRVGVVNTVPMARFRGRLQRRAMAASLRQLRDRLREPDQANSEEKPAMELYWQYQTLHRTLIQAWISRFGTTDMVQIVAPLQLIAIAASFILNVAVGNCVALWQLLAMGCLTVYFLFELVYIAESNLQIDAITDLYVSAQASLRMLAAPADPGAASPSLRGEIAAHDAVLGLFLEQSARYRRRVLGITVGYGTVRGIAASWITVLLGLWSVLRAAGVRVTMESVCPLF